MWIDTSSGQNLVGLSILSLERLLNCLKLLLENEIAQTSFAMHIVHDVVELFKKLLFLLLDVLILLETHLILPFDILVFFLGLNNLLLLFRQLFANLVVFDLPFKKTSNLFLDMLEGLDDHVVVCVLDHLLTVGRSFTNLLVFEVTSERADHVHVESGDVVVVVMDVLILRVVLGLQLFDSLVLLGFDFGNFSLALGLHVLSESSHLGLVLFLDLVGDALILLALSCG